MKIPALLVFLACLSISCSSGGDNPQIAYTGPTNAVLITQPTSGATYTTLYDSVTLYGIRDASISSVDWKNLATGATGTGYIYDYIDWCFFFGYYQCTKHEWGVLVPLQDGQNVIRIFGNGSFATSITVARTPSSEISGAVTFSNIGQNNIELTLTDSVDPSRVYTAYTDTTGFYRFSLITAGTYSLAPTDTCYTFSPVSQDVTILTSDIANMDFAVVAKPLAAVGGRITWSAGGTGTYSAWVKLTNALTLADVSAVPTNPYGYFTFTCVPDGQYTITPLPAFQGLTLSFAPAFTNVVVNGQDITNVDFQASLTY